jgi:hypothetical protein
MQDCNSSLQSDGDGSDCDSEKLAIRYNTRIALLYRDDSRDTLLMRYTSTICLVLPLTRTESCDTYLILNDTNFYGNMH